MILLRWNVFISFIDRMPFYGPIYIYDGTNHWNQIFTRNYTTQLFNGSLVMKHSLIEASLECVSIFFNEYSSYTIETPN